MPQESTTINYSKKEWKEMGMPLYRFYFKAEDDKPHKRSHFNRCITVLGLRRSDGCPYYLGRVYVNDSSYWGDHVTALRLIRKVFNYKLDHLHRPINKKLQVYRIH